jgi:hypothetical protein
MSSYLNIIINTTKTIVRSLRQFVCVFITGTVSRDFRPLVFSSNYSFKASDKRGKSFLKMASNSQNRMSMEACIVATAGSTTKLSQMIILIFCLCYRYIVVQFGNIYSDWFSLERQQEPLELTVIFCFLIFKV